MTEYNAHSLVLVGETQQRASSQQARQTALASVLGTGAPITESLGAEPGKQSFRGLYRGNDSEKLMAELQELTENSAADFDAIALYGRNETTTADGYYSLDRIEPSQPRPDTRALWSYDLGLRNKRTPKTHRKAVRTKLNAYNTSDNEQPFNASGTTVEVAILNASSNVRWFDTVNKSYEQATTTGTNATQFGDVDLYDVAEPTFTDPILLYDLDFEEEATTDTRVWDTRGHINRTDNGTLQWQRVFDPGHRFQNETAVIENGVLRLTFNESSNTLSAEEWNESAGDYDDKALNPSDWELWDLDVERIGRARTLSEVAFRNTSDDSIYFTEFDQKRGYNQTVITIPDNEDRANFPSNLSSKLDPIASEIETDPTADLVLIRREDTRL